jgi:peptidoglycan/xylan/chitin deacetylase (PgdA/CDA1 family)
MSLPFRNNIIVMYHVVNDAAWFVNSIKLLKKFYKIVPITEVNSFVNENRPNSNMCVLSFDDGDDSFYSVVYPALKEHKIPAVLYVSPKKIIERKNFWFQEVRGYDKIRLKEIISEVIDVKFELINHFDTNSLLKCLQIQQIEEIISIYKRETKEKDKACMLVTDEQLIEMYTSGLVTIGAHTQNHPILANEDVLSSKNEICGSMVELGAILNSQVKYFAYPNGLRNLDYTQREVEILEKEGIEVSVTTNVCDFNKSNQRQEIPRIGLSYGSNLHILGKIILGKHWEKLKNRNNESNQRKTIYDLLRHSNKVNNA